LDVCAADAFEPALSHDFQVVVPAMKGDVFELTGYAGSIVSGLLFR
jgi:hypothetical protein